MPQERARTIASQWVQGTLTLPSEETQVVATGQIVSSTSLTGAQPAAEMDDVSRSFFAEGNHQEQIGLYVESRPYRGSLDRIPRHHGHRLLLLAGLLAPVIGLAWWMGWRLPPGWEPATVWRAALHLIGR